MRMSFTEKVQLLERLDQLIRLKATGTPDELGLKLKVARCTVYDFIACLESLGGEIEYSRSNRSFIYVTDKTLIIGYKSKLNQ